MEFKFSEISYERPDMEKMGQLLGDYTNKVTVAETFDELMDVFMMFQEKMAEAATMFTVCNIRHTLNTTDEFYEKEIAYLEEQLPLLNAKIVAFNDALINCKFHDELEEKYGKMFFASMELEKKGFCEENIPLMQREAKLTNEYQKIMATAEIPFQGEVYNLTGIQKFFEDKDRGVRRGAFKAYSDFYHSNENRLEEIWAELIEVRNEMGRNLGFDNFIPLGYIRQGRMDYGQEEVATFRKQVYEEIVPLCETLYKAQAKRIGVDKVMAYDEKMVFSDGNADPAGDDDFMVAKAREMYHKLSKETAEFVDFMIDHELMDLKNKPGKAATGYMTDLPKYKAPFVFSCFNGTIGDMQVLTHELGHAFAGYQAMRHQPIQDFYTESTDIAEIHSMSMEQFAYPYAEMFFEDADKFRFNHLQDAITFVPFGVCVDEFQHICYANPQLTPKERTLEWKKLEEKYMPWRAYDADDFFDRGGMWYHKLHIFLYPMYYINYTFTTMGAMEFKKKATENFDIAWQDYLKLCNCGGSLGYKETLKHANLSVPFEEGSVKKCIEIAKQELLNSKYVK